MEQRDGGPVLTAYVNAFSSVGHGSHQNGLEGPEIIAGSGFWRFSLKIVAQVDKIKNSRGEMPDRLPVLMGNIARHRKRFEVHLRPHHCAADIEHHPIFQIFP